MYRVELLLTNYSQLRLDEFRFYDPSLSEPLITKNGGASTYCINSSQNLFTWTTGVRAVTLLLLRAATGYRELRALSGGAKSFAASLDYALSKEPAWLLDFFGATAQGWSVARKIFGRRNSERKRQGPVEVYVNETLLPATNIRIYVNEQLVDNEEILKLISVFELPDAAEESRDSTTADSKQAKTTNEEFPLLVRDRILRNHIDLERRISRYEMTTVFHNEGTSPIAFTHYNFFSEGDQAARNIRIESPAEGEVPWEPVQSIDGRLRVMAKFRRPIMPGLTRVETVSYENWDYSDIESYLVHTSRYPTERLTLEVSCSVTMQIADAVLIASKELESRFTSLPPVQHGVNTDGFSCARWTMAKPPRGFKFQLFWGLEVAGTNSRRRAKCAERLEVPFELNS